VLDNTLSLVDNIQSSIYSCIDIYNSELSNKMNKTMQLLTVITVSTLPLTVVSGIFGMNFSNMPLISSNNGFYLSIIITLIIIILQILYFKRKKYI
ncbi:CorA family divalent cation transporter, partial [Clostridium perfringens]|uniref:CorA family divalent cation transporter n=2 Tax=Clostridium TaxID=1485 RepID=UPI002ACDF420